MDAVVLTNLTSWTLLHVLIPSLERINKEEEEKGFEEGEIEGWDEKDKIGKMRDIYDEL